MFKALKQHEQDNAYAIVMKVILALILTSVLFGVLLGVVAVIFGFFI